MRSRADTTDDGTRGRRNSRLRLLAVLVVLSAAAAAPARPLPAHERTKAFSVEVSLSAAAARRLAAGHETIIVSASYFGTPTKAAEVHADPVGQIDLGRAQRELPGPGVADFDGSGIAHARLRWISDAPQVNINVFSGRKSSPDNLLDCEFFQDTVAIAASHPIALHCKLIDEK